MCVILTISYLRARKRETSPLRKDSMRFLFNQIEMFSGILTVYFNCHEYLFSLIYVELLERLLGISPSGRNPYGGNKKALRQYFPSKNLHIGKSVKRKYISTEFNSREISVIVYPASRGYIFEV